MVKGYRLLGYKSTNLLSTLKMEQERQANCFKSTRFRNEWKTLNEYILYLYTPYRLIPCSERAYSFYLDNDLLQQNEDKLTECESLYFLYFR